MRPLLGSMVALAITAMAAPAFATNAATYYQQAYDALPEFLQNRNREQSQQALLDYDLFEQAQRHGLQSLTQEQRAHIEEILVKSQPALKLFIKGSLAKEYGGDTVSFPARVLRLKLVAAVQMEAFLQEGKISETQELLAAIFQAGAQNSTKQPGILDSMLRFQDETRAAKVLADHFSKLGADDLRQLSLLLTKAPEWPSAATIIRADQKLLTRSIDSEMARADASSDPREAMQKAAKACISPAPLSVYFSGKEPSVKESRKLLETLKSDFATLANLAEQPAPENAEKAQAFFTEIRERKEVYSLLSRNVLILPLETFARVQQANLLRAALRTAISIKEQGSNLPAEARDPLTGSVFLCRRTKEGFDLEPKDPLIREAGTPKELILSFR